MKTQRKFLKNWHQYPGKGEARGINHTKKVENLKKLTPFMNKSSLKFWQEIPTNSLSSDLTMNIDHLPH